MENGKWKMINEKWKMKNFKFSILHYQLSIINFHSPSPASVHIPYEPYPTALRRRH